MASKGVEQQRDRRRADPPSPASNPRQVSRSSRCPALLCAGSAHQPPRELAGSQQAVASGRASAQSAAYTDEPVRGVAARLCFMVDGAADLPLSLRLSEPSKWKRNVRRERDCAVCALVEAVTRAIAIGRSALRGLLRALRHGLEGRPLAEGRSWPAGSRCPERRTAGRQRARQMRPAPVSSRASARTMLEASRRRRARAP